MYRSTRWGRLAASLSFAMNFGATRSATAERIAEPSGAPQFVAGPCPSGWVRPEGIDSAWVSCGTMVVPQNRRDPNPKSLVPVTLSVVVYQSASVRRGAAPVVFLAGGPGESAISMFTDVVLATPVGQLLLRERPIVTFDQRGFGARAGRARPDLGMLDYTPAETRQQSLAALRDQARRLARGLRARGVEPANFTTSEAVADLEDLLRALGFERVVLFGTSYGTKYALQFMRLHPEMVERAILDGVAPPNRDDIFEPEKIDAARRSVIRKIAADCTEDAACQVDFPGLPGLVDRLDRPDAPPLRVVANYPTGGGWRDLKLSPRDVLTALGAFAGSDEIRSLLPQLLVDFARGDTLRRAYAPQLAIVAAAMGRVSTTAGPFYPLAYHSVFCAELRDGVPQVGGRALCDALGVPFAGATTIAPVQSDVPTLLLSSAYDTQTPPDLAEEAARTLPRSFRVTFRGVGHVAFHQPTASACAAVVIQSFLIDATHPPATSCVTATMPSFLPASVTMPAPAR